MAFDSLPFLAFLTHCCGSLLAASPALPMGAAADRQLRVLRYLGATVCDLACIVYVDCLCFSPID